MTRQRLGIAAAAATVLVAAVLATATSCSGPPGNRTADDSPSPTASSVGPTTGAPGATPPRRDATHTRPPLPTAKADSGLRATSLRGSSRCGPPGTQDSYADLTWKPASTRGTQHIAYSPYADGYRTGRYQLTANLSPGATKVTVKELEPGVTYTWLVLTKHGDRWDASATAQFTGPICTVDPY